MEIDARLLNIIVLGFGFMFVFTAFQTTGNIEATVLNSIKATDSSFTGDGYISLAIVYIVFAMCNWVAPSVIALTSPKIAMIGGGVIYTLFILNFLIPQTWLLYLMSAVIGFGAAIIWTGQGSYLILNSDKSTINRNSGIFWAMLQCSMFFGNLFVYFQFQGLETIDQETRNITFTVLGVVAAIGIGFFVVLRPAKTADGSVAVDNQGGPLLALKRSIKLFTTRDMILLTLTFFYTGVILSFFSGVYGTVLGNTKRFDDPKTLVGLNGIFVGVGEVLGGLLFTIMGTRFLRWGRDPIVIGGFVFHMLAFFLVFINIPNVAVLEETTDEAYIDSNPVLALFCSFLFGFGDSCFNTQIYSMLGSIWAADSSPAMAIFKFVQSLAAAICFFYSSNITLVAHLSILIALATAGTVTFCVVEWIHKTRQRRQSTDVSEASSAEKF